MPYRDILLPLFTYPDALPEATLDAAAAIAGRLGAASGGEVAALALEVRIRPTRNRLASLLAGIDDVVRNENARNAERARATAAAWEAVASRRGLKGQARVQPADLYGEAVLLAELARTRDVCLLPVGPTAPTDHAVAEAVLFGSGRPAVVFPEDGKPGPAPTFERIAVAWDGSRAAARALADALPLLKAASSVRLLTILDEKPAATSGVADEAARHLAVHGIAAEVVELAAAGRPIGRVLEAEVPALADLLVMGGFGHSRARDFLLGGATQAVLRRPPLPVFLAH